MIIRCILLLTGWGNRYIRGYNKTIYQKYGLMDEIGDVGLFFESKNITSIQQRYE